MVGEDSKINPKTLALTLVVLAAIGAGVIVWLAGRKAAHFEIETEDSGLGGTAVLVSSADAVDLSRLWKQIQTKRPGLSVADIRSLDLEEMPTLESLEGIEIFESLESLIVIGCEKLGLAESLTPLTKLRELVLNDCPSLKITEEFKLPAELETLDLSGAVALEQLSAVDSTKLQSLFLSGCGKLRSLNLSGCSELQQLFIDGCRSLPEIAGLADLKNLTDLDVSTCHSLKHLNGLPKLESLLVLDLRNALEISNFSEVGAVSSLEVLRLGGQTQLTDLKPLSGLDQLREIHVEACENLASLDGLPESLTDYAGFTFCPNLESIGALENAINLQRLDLSGCEKLQEISVLGRLPELRNLSLAGCRSVADVAILENLENLRIVQLGGTGVRPSAVSEIQKKRPEIIFDFSGLSR